MDCPHPLDILGDPASYGPTGAISRFHNPDNYTAALGGVLRAQVPPPPPSPPWGSSCDVCFAKCRSTFDRLLLLDILASSCCSVPLLPFSTSHPHFLIHL